jgi:MFS family permease
MRNLSLVHEKHTELTGHMAIVAVATMIGTMFAGSTLLTPLYVMYKQAYGFSGVTLTLIYATYVVGNLGALLLFGRASDQLGRRAVALPALAVAALSTLVFLFAEGTTALFIGRALNGLGIGVAVGTGNAWLAELVGKDKARASVISTGANFVGLGLGPLVSGILAQYAAWPFRLSFVVNLGCVAVVALLIRQTTARIAQASRSTRSATSRCGRGSACRGRFALALCRRRWRASGPWRCSASSPRWRQACWRRSFTSPITLLPAASCSSWRSRPR